MKSIKEKNTEEELRKITSDDLKVLRKKLKPYGSIAKDKIVNAMNAIAKDKNSMIYKSKPFNVSTLYNLLNGVVTNRVKLLIFYETATNILAELEKKESELTK